MSNRISGWCRYIRRRAREEFGRTPIESGQDISAIKAELDVVKRQGIVYSLYSRGSKSVMVCATCTSAVTICLQVTLLCSNDIAGFAQINLAIFGSNIIIPCFMEQQSRIS